MISIKKLKEKTLKQDRKVAVSAFRVSALEIREPNSDQLKLIHLLFTEP